MPANPIVLNRAALMALLFVILSLSLPALAQDKPAQVGKIATGATHRVAIHVDDNDPRVMNLALNNAKNVLEYYEAKKETVAIEIVAYGPGLHMLRSDTSPVKQRIGEMSMAPQISFAACGNTRANMAKQEAKDVPLLSEARVVPSGVVRLMELQKQGYAYIHPSADKSRSMQMPDTRDFTYHSRRVRSMRCALIWLCGVLHGFFVLAAQVLAQQAVPLGRYETRLMREINSATIGLAAGLPEGAPLRFATELARIVDDGTKMRVLPIVTRGPFENVNDLLYLRGVDAAIVNGDVLEHFKKDPKIAGIDKRIHYLTHLFPSEVHVFVRPEIKRLSRIWPASRLISTPTARQRPTRARSFSSDWESSPLRSSCHTLSPLPRWPRATSFAAVVFVSAKPLDPFVRRKWPEGFRFLPVPLTEKLEEYYLPAQLEAGDYPGLIAEGQSIETIAVPAVLAVYAWPRGSDRYDRIARFIDYLFARLPRLKEADGYHPKWRELSLAAPCRAGGALRPCKPNWTQQPRPRARPSSLLLDRERPRENRAARTDD